MKELPKRYLSSKARKDMWRDAKKIITKLDKALDFSEIYVDGSFVSKKNRPADIDFAIVTKLAKRNKKGWPIDIVILPAGEDSEYYLKDIKKWLKNRYGKECVPVRLK